MMVLKEAFREQNFLDNLITQATYFISRTENIIQKKQEHMRKASNPEAENEIVEVPRSVEVDYTPNDVVNFIMNVVEEKEKLTKAIAVAKAQSEIDIDSSISLNKTKQTISKILKNMSEIKSGESLSTARAQKFNVAGDPVSYSYDVKTVSTIDFDRNLVKSLAKKLNKDSDVVSTQIDKLNVSLEVDYSPIYEIGDSLDDCIEIFLKK